MEPVAMEVVVAVVEGYLFEPLWVEQAAAVECLYEFAAQMLQCP